MKKALNAWTVEKSADMEQTFAAVAKAGFAGIELNVDAPGAPHGLSMETTAADYADIRRLSEKYQLPVCSIASSLGWQAGMGNPAHWDDGQALLYKQIEAARELGAGGILIVPGGIGGDITLDAARKNCVAFLQSHRRYIEQHGIFVGVENVWNGFFLSPYDMASFIDAVDSPLVGAYLDVGNASGVISMEQQSGGVYWGQISGIAAKALDDTYYVAGLYNDGDGNPHCTGVIPYSLSQYCMNNAYGSMGQLSQATALYGYYAARYFGK